jgi:hypothetical protein
VHRSEQNQYGGGNQPGLFTGKVRLLAAVVKGKRGADVGAAVHAFDVSGDDLKRELVGLVQAARVVVAAMGAERATARQEEAGVRQLACHPRTPAGLGRGR